MFYFRVLVDDNVDESIRINEFKYLSNKIAIFIDLIENEESIDSSFHMKLVSFIKVNIKFVFKWF